MHPAAAVVDGLRAISAVAVDLELEDSSPIVRPSSGGRVVLAMLVLVGEITLSRDDPHP
jgi:hypothetical protein